MDAQQLEHWILETCPGVIVTDAYRERSFFYNPDGSLPKGIYLATIKESDGPNDRASHLDRDGVYRLSIGLGKKQYQKVFGDVPERPGKGKTIDAGHDFTELGKLMPHPIYAWIGWVCINNPGMDQMDLLQHLLEISYQNAFTKFARKK